MIESSFLYISFASVFDIKGNFILLLSFRSPIRILLANSCSFYLLGEYGFFRFSEQ